MQIKLKEKNKTCVWYKILFQNETNLLGFNKNNKNLKVILK